MDERPLFAPLAYVAFGGLERDAERGSEAAVLGSSRSTLVVWTRTVRAMAIAKL